MFEQGRKVWWPLKWREYDENGNEVERGMTVLFAGRAWERGMQRGREALAYLLAARIVNQVCWFGPWLMARIWTLAPTWLRRKSSNANV